MTRFCIRLPIKTCDLIYVMLKYENMGEIEKGRKNLEVSYEKERKKILKYYFEFGYGF